MSLSKVAGSILITYIVNLVLQQYHKIVITITIFIINYFAGNETLV